MKKKLAAYALVLALAAVQTTSVFAYGSKGSSGLITANGDVTLERQNTASANDGKVYGDAKINFPTDNNTATAGLPQTTVAQINSINSGASLADAIKDVDLNNYYALGETHAAVVTNKNTGAASLETVPVTVYVPNLVEGLNNIQILFYNNATGRWELLTPSAVNYAAKTVTLNVTGSGTLSVVYKK